MPNDSREININEPLDSEQIIARYNAGTASQAERAFVESWYVSGQFAGSLTDEEHFVEDFLQSRELLVKHMNPVKKTIKIWPRVAVVAAAVTAIAFGVYFFTYRNDEIASVPRNDVAYKNDIAPGHNGARLTLANGKTIELSGAKSGVVITTATLTYDDGTVVDPSLRGGDPSLRGGTTKQSPLELTASTARGEAYIFTLPDGTKVWLNAASTVKFPSSFAGNKTRKVEITGEAYLEVFKNKAQPFVVISKNQEIKVLGTHFNINAYDDEAVVKTTLLEGSVLLSSLRGTKQSQDNVFLKPGQMALNTGNRINVTEANTDLETAWVKNDFYFDEASTESVMQSISRWYNITVSYQTEDLKNIPLSGHISRTRTLATVLERISKATQLHFSIEGQQVTIKK